MADDPRLITLLEENAALKAAAPAPTAVGHKAVQFVWAVIILSILGVASVIALTIVQPEKDNAATINLILGLLVPSVVALLAAAVRENHLAMNSRMTEMLKLQQKASLAEGELVGRAKADIVNELMAGTGRTLSDHDSWERGERVQTHDAIAENTHLTRKILAKVDPPDPRAGDAPVVAKLTQIAENTAATVEALKEGEKGP